MLGDRRVQWKMIQLSSADRKSSPVVSHWAAVSPMIRQPKPAMIAPNSGANNKMVAMVPYPFITLTSSTSIVPRLRKKVTRIARPIAASAAATVRMNRVNTCPTRSPR